MQLSPSFICWIFHFSKQKLCPHQTPSPPSPTATPNPRNPGTYQRPFWLSEFDCKWNQTVFVCTWCLLKCIFQFSHSVVSNSLWPHGLQHSRPPCPSPTPRIAQTHVHWVGDAIQPYHLLSNPSPPAFNLFPAFPMSQFFESGSQSIGVSALVPVLSMNTQDWFPLGLIGWISLQSKGLSRVFSNTTVKRHQFFGAQLSLWFNSHIQTWLPEKP